MVPWLTSLLYDPKSFANFIRAGVFLVGELTKALGPTAKYYWLGMACQAAALVIRAGDKNVVAGAGGAHGEAAPGA